MQRENLRHYIAGTALVLLAGSITFAQQPSELDQVKARQRISMLEGVLERAVSNGADNMVRQMKAVMGDAPMLTGVPEVRGFRLDGYGVFFDVEVPALRLPVTWPLRYMFRDNRETMGIVNELLEPYAGAVLAKIFVLVALILFIQRRPRGLFPQAGRAAEDK